MPPEDETLTLQQAANVLNVSTDELRRLLNSGAIQPLHSEGVNRADLLKYKQTRDIDRSNALTELALIDRDLL